MAMAQVLDAPSLDRLISELSVMRSDMQPPVRALLPSLSDKSSNGVIVTMEDSPTMQLAVLRDGRIRLWVRSSGFGWLAFNLDMRGVGTLCDWISANVKVTNDPII